MNKPPAAPKPSRKKSSQDRRSPSGPPGSVPWVKGLLGRPLVLERQDSRLRVALAERRRPPEQIQAQTLAELQALLQRQSQGPAPAELAQVHRRLAHQGWAAVEAMASEQLGQALVQLLRLDSPPASPALASLAEQLQALHTAAQRRESRPAHASPASVEVSETTHEEFEALERRWRDTVASAPQDPAEPAAAGRDGEPRPARGPGSDRTP